jgi:hypothetical protein
MPQRLGLASFRPVRRGRPSRSAGRRTKLGRCPEAERALEQALGIVPADRHAAAARGSCKEGRGGPAAPRRGRFRRRPPGTAFDAVTRWPLLALALLHVPAGVTAEAGSPEWPLVPGRMGFNALPALENVDPVIGHRGEYAVGAATQLSGLRGRDVAATPYFRLTLPFREVAAIEVEGTPLELYRTSASTQARLDARRREGIAQGDLRFGARFLLLEEGRAPAIGLRILVKSTTGKALHSRRFTNAPGYEIDLLAGRDVGVLGAARFRALGRLGLAVWQFAPDRQDDALAYGATLRAAAKNGAALAVEWRGYVGWRFDDRPSLLGFTASAPLGGAELQATLNRGISSDAPPLELRVGAVARFDMPRFARERRDPPGEPPRPAPSRARPTEALAEAQPEGGAARP